MPEKNRVELSDDREPDLDPFLAAICAEPDDDLPRLVWADWLEDRGDPRAEFVRLQMAEYLGEPGDPDRCRELEQLHGGKWAGPLADWAYSIIWRRGCPEHLVMPAEVFLDFAPHVFELAPVRGLTLIGAAARVRELVRVRELTRLHALHLTGTRLGDSGLDRLASCPYLDNLRTLHLGQCGITSDGVRSLVDAAALRRLTTLDLSGNAIDSWGVKLLADCNRFPLLTRLDLRRNDFDPAILSALRRSPNYPRLVELIADRPVAAIAG